MPVKVTQPMLDAYNRVYDNTQYLGITDQFKAVLPPALELQACNLLIDACLERTCSNHPGRWGMSETQLRQLLLAYVTGTKWVDLTVAINRYLPRFNR